jgi:hypothetical protein
MLFYLTDKLENLMLTEKPLQEELFCKSSSAFALLLFFV